MKKTLIALMVLVGVAHADIAWDESQSYTYTWDFSAASVLGGTVTNSFDVVTADGRTYITSLSGKKSYREDHTSFLYNAVSAAVETEATLTLTLDYYYEGSDWGETILHVGRGDKNIGYGVSFGLAPGGYLSVTIARASDENFGATKSSVQLTQDAWNTITFTPAVPEPTTATLSLLALAGLAARRRRASR